MNDQDAIVEDGALCIDGARLAYVGPIEDMPPGRFDRVLDGQRMLAIPGMINAHCHSAANLVRGLFASRPLEIWRTNYRASLADKRYEDTVPLGDTSADVSAVVVEGGRLTRMREEEVLRLARGARERLNLSFQREIAAAESVESALAEMYFRVLGGTE
jgi:hypothetical protein